jgi:hypothetical protein
VAGPSWQQDDQRLLPAPEPAERVLHLAERSEGVQAIAARPQLTGRLRTTQQQEGEHGARRTVQSQELGGGLTVLDRPGAVTGVHQARQPGGPQLRHRGSDLGLFEGEDRVAPTGLVAR